MAETPALPDGTVTVVFTDVEGSTALRSAVGDDRGHGILSEHDDVVRKLLVEHGGVEVKALGDGFLLVFTSTRRAVEFAVGLHAALDRARLGPADRPVRVRVGMHTGEVVARDGDLFGQAVHAAARIQAVAMGGQTLVSAVVKALVGSLDGVTWQDVGEHELKGFDEPWGLWAAEGIPDTGTDDGRVPLVARGPQYQRLLTALDEAGRGTGGAVLIQGAAGVGKSRLAAEVADEAERRGFRVLRSRCNETSVATPFAPWVDLLRGGIEDTDPETLRAALGDAGAEIARVLPELRTMFPDIPEPQRLPAEQERRFILESVAGFIARGSANRPLVLLIDDVHWADEASVALLEETTPHVRHFPILFLATARPPEQPLASVIARGVKDRDIALIDLDPLDHHGVSELLEALTDQQPPNSVVLQMTAKTGGNPFYVTELVQHLREEGIGFDDEGNWEPDPDLAGAGVPDSIRLVLQARLDRVTDDVRSILAGAAIVGRSSELKIAGRVADAAPAELVDALDVAEKSGLVITEVDGAGRTLVTFAHDLIRDAVLADLTVIRSQQLHLRAAEAIRDFHGVHPQAAPAIAAHMLSAGALADPNQTCAALCAAGDGLVEATAYPDALELYEHALELVEPRTPMHAHALRGLGTVMRSTEGWEASLPIFMEALEIFVDLGDADEVSSLITEIVLELAWAFRILESFDVIEKGMKALADLGVAGSESWMLLASSRAALLALLGVYDQATEALDEIVEMGGGAGRIPPTYALPILQARAMMCDLPGVLDLIDNATDGVREEAGGWTLAEYLGWIGFNLVGAGRIDEAREGSVELEPLVESLGQMNAKVLLLRRKSLISLIDDEPQVALEYQREDERICREQGFPWVAQAWVFQAQTHLLLGEWDEADHCVRRALSEDVFGSFAGTGAGIAALLRAYEGDVSNVERLHREHVEPHLGAPVLGIGQYAAFPTMALALGWAGLHEQAGSLQADLERWLEDGWIISTWTPCPLALPAAVAAAGAGDAAAADAHLDATRAVIDRLELPWRYHEIDRWAALVALMLGRAGDAPALLDAAEAAHRQTGQEPHLELVTQLRARGGG